MEPLTMLMNEHRVIEKVLDCLEVIANQAQDDHRLDGDSAAQAIDFFRSYADKCHHAKEEDELFPLLESKGFSPEEGPTGVMRIEHDEGRGYIRYMADNLEAAADGGADALECFTINAKRYVDMLRMHIQKEDTCLYPMAEEAISESESKELKRVFEDLRVNKIGVETITKYEDIADALAEKFGVMQAA